ncbi:MAG: 4-alpha-glucanotransferase, partial [Pseudomonadota bacterium]
MSPGNPLDRLAAAHRIESDYIDIWGQRQTIGENSKRALLAAMGVAADSDTEIDASLEAARQEAFSRLAPVGLVITDGEPLKVPVTTNAVASGRIAWRFVTESGEQMEGDAVLSALDVSEATASRIRRPLPLPLRPAPGYHRLTLTFDDRETAETEIIVTPKRAFWPSCLDRHGGVAGLTAPLYGLRSGRNAGIGDFTDLAVLATKTAPMGADFIGINPVHALFPAEPGRISPYSPSSRLFLNTLLIALDQVPELMPSEAARQLLNDSDTLQRLRASDLVDYPAVADFKL